MAGNGGNIEEQIQHFRQRNLLHGASSVDAVIPVLTRGAHAMLDASRALEAVALNISKIGTDTARAISDTIELKRYLKDVTEREQKLCSEVELLRQMITTASGRVKRKQLEKIVKKHKQAKR